MIIRNETASTIHLGFTNQSGTTLAPAETVEIPDQISLNESFRAAKLAGVISVISYETDDDDYVVQKELTDGLASLDLDSWLATKDTDDLTEGAINKYSNVWEKDGTTGKTQTGIDDIEIAIDTGKTVSVKGPGGSLLYKIESDGEVHLFPFLSEGIILRAGGLERLQLRNILDSQDASLLALKAYCSLGVNVGNISSGELLKQEADSVISVVNHLNTQRIDFWAKLLQSDSLRLVSYTYGGTDLYTKYAAIVDLSSSTQITMNIPSDGVILSTAFVVKTAITGSGGLTDWSAAYSGGSSLPVVSSIALAKNTKAKKAHAGIETTATTQIQISANGSETFSTGEIVAVALVREIGDLDSFA